MRPPRPLRTMLVTTALLATGAAPAEPPPWDVDGAPGPRTEASWTLHEGTWMGVDVHPDGDRIVFDLLGDLYVLPIAGGTATRITSGAAWDGEARWSPDGTQLVFTSDRGGNANLWLADADGGRPRALTAEKDARVSDAAWTPDGEHLVARKRFTDTSSIGVHELWLFDRYGGAGIALTKKEEVAGLGEPAASPDGRSLYYSARTARYRYDRDPNEGIWQVQRLDRQTGRSHALTGEFGGAVRPTPSPDGRTLAIVRRVREETHLELFDLETGARTPLADWLSRDEQEGFAVNGLYPRIDWTPDGERLVLWAQGGLWSVDAATGERTAIPFTAEASLSITEAVRPQRSPVHEAVAAKLVRWPVLSPGGDRVAYGALGSIWTRPWAGTSKRLTAEPHREYAPAWSPDGRWLVWVSWSDEHGGAVHVRPAAGGKVRTVGRVGPKYSNPSFSPDGRKIVVLRGSGAPARGQDLAAELWSEVVVLDLDAGTADVVGETAGLKRGARPVFSPDGRRVLFPEEREVPLAAADGVLISVNLDGSDRRVVLEIGQATDILPSPDGAWVAFQEDHHAWVARVPEAGLAPLKIAREGGAVPVWRLSEEAGDWVSFSPDGAFVSWSDGPELRRLRLTDLLAWHAARQEEARAKAAAAKAAGAGPEEAEEGAEEEADVPPSELVILDASLPRAVPQGAVAITGARIVTMQGDTVIEAGTLLTRGDRIVAVGPDGSVEIPADAHRIDGAGTTILPGIIDVHAHLHFSAVDTLPEQDWRYLAALAYGVTTVHDPSVFTDEAFAFGELVETGAMWGPRVFSTGEILYGASGNFRSDVQGPDDAARHVHRMQKLGAISVKSYQQPRRDQRQWIVQAAREAGILVVPEGGGDTFGNLSMIADGHSAIEHALPTTPLYADIVGLFAASGTFYTPTLLVAYGGAFGEHYFYARSPVWQDAKLLSVTPQGVLDARGRRLRLVAPEGDWHHQDVARSAAAVQRAGGHVTLGGHGQLQGLGSHWELWGLAGPGAMTPLEAIRSATLHGAMYLGMEQDLGSLEPGKLADFFVVDGDPLQRIEDSAKVRWTVKNGVLYDASNVDRLWPDPAPAPRTIHEVARADVEGGCAAERGE